MKTQLICLSGTGATGKTSLVNAVVKGTPHSFQPYGSVVREYYALKGVANEKVWVEEKRSFQERFEFQTGFFDFYMERLTDALDKCTHPFMLSERAAFDHAAYTLFGLGDDLTKEHYFEVRSRMQPFLDLCPLVVLMPFPVHFSEVNSDDGFRYRHFSKDLIIDAYIRKLAYDLQTNYVDALDLLEGDLTISERASLLVSYVDSMCHVKA